MATEQTPPSGKSRPLALPLTMIVLTVAAVVTTASRGREPIAAISNTFGSQVASITLPYDEPDLPPGPHRREFQIACTTCHSTRLALTQPAFPKAKWQATVKKMVDAFGAPLSRDDQARAVEYLMAVRGKK